jgi:hypothetical protein
MAINRNNRKAEPIPVVPRTAQIVNADGTVTRTGMLLLEQLQEATAGEPGPAGAPGAPGAAGADRPQIYWRTIDIQDTAVGDNIAPNLSVQGSGTGIKITGILRLAITANLVVRINVAGLPIGTLTIPSSTAVRTEVSTPITTVSFVLGQDMTFDITGSDASQDEDGVATVTVKWGTAVETVTVTGQWQGPWGSGATYVLHDAVSWAGSSWISLQNANTGHSPDTSPTWWDMLAQRGDDGAAGVGVPAGGTTGEALVKLSTTDYDTGWSAVGSGTVTHTAGALTADLPVFGNSTGDIKVGTKSGSTNELATVSGTLTNGHLLMVDAGGNVVDGGPPGTYVPLTTKGDLVTYDTDVVRLGVGSNGQVLTADSTQAKGIKWSTGVPGGGTPAYISSLIAGPDTAKTITGATHGYATAGLLVAVYDNASPRNAIEAGWTVNASTFDVVVTFATAQSNYYIVINGAVGQTGATGATGGSSPLTTKGDLFGYSTVDARIPVGNDEQAFFADSGQTLGLKWGTDNILRHPWGIANSPWVITQMTAVSAIADSGGRFRGVHLAVTGSAAVLEQGPLSLPASSTFRLRVMVKITTGQYFVLLITDKTANSFGKWFDLTGGVTGGTNAVGTAAVTSATITSLGSSWYTIEVIGTLGSASNNYYFTSYPTSANSSLTTTNTHAVDLWNPSLVRTA